MDLNKKYSHLYIGDSADEIEDMISNRWRSDSSIEKALEKVELLTGPDKIIYKFLIAIIQGKWVQGSEILIGLEEYVSGFTKYQKISYQRMKAMASVARSDISGTIEILEQCYDEVPQQMPWLRRTIAVDLRNGLLNNLILEKNDFYNAKHNHWQKILSQHRDQNPLADKNDSSSLKSLLREYLETSTKDETVSRISNNLSDAIKAQYKNLIFSARIGYYTGFFNAKHNIGLILYQWANVLNDSYLHMNSLIEFIENANKKDIENYFTKHSDLLVGNRSNAIYLFEKVQSLDETQFFDEIRLIVFRHIYDYLEDIDCENIDKFIKKILEMPSLNHHCSEMKILALKILPFQSYRISPNWFIDFALKKIKKNDENFSFNSELIGCLSSLNVEKCEKEKISDLTNEVLENYYAKRQLTNDASNVFNITYNFIEHSKLEAPDIDKIIVDNSNSKKEAFEKNLFYFSRLKHDDFSDNYKEYIESCIDKFIEGSKLKEIQKSYSIGGNQLFINVLNIVINNYETINEHKLIKNLTTAVFEYCLCPYISEDKKRFSFFILLELLNKTERLNTLNVYQQEVKNKFEDFASAVDLRIFQGRKKTILGALAGNVYLSMGGLLTPSLWNHIINDRNKTYKHKKDCVDAIIKIINRTTEYSTVAFYVLSDLINDSSHRVACHALTEMVAIKELPNNVLPMICQSISTQSKSGLIIVRRAAVYCIKKLLNKINNEYWSKNLNARYEEMLADDSRLVRIEAVKQ